MGVGFRGGVLCGDGCGETKLGFAVLQGDASCGGHVEGSAPVFSHAFPCAKLGSR